MRTRLPALLPTLFPTLLAALASGAAPRALAAQVADPLGDFLPTYTGPRNADLDVVSAAFTFDGRTTFRLSSTSAGAIGTTPGAPFVWGIDRGDGRATFANLGLPDIRFDAIVALIPGGPSLFLDLVGGGAPVSLAPGAVRIAGNTIEARVPLALLTSQGLSPRAYTANVWPRSRPVLDDDGVISDFAPDDRNIRVAVTPEPATVALAGAGLLALAAASRRRWAAARGGA